MKYKHAMTVHYIVLLCILALGVGSFFALRFDRQAQLLVGIITAVSYTVWGIVHHIAQGQLHRKVVIEYVLIGAIAVVLLLTLMGP